MRHLVCLFAFSIALAAQAPADVQRKLVGHWRLVSFQNVDAAGVARPAQWDAGRITYDTAGNMSAQLMNSARKPLGQPSTEVERAAAYAGFVAYYGRYTLDPALARITHHVEGALNPNWVKTDLVRYYAFSADGNRLMLSIRNGERVTGTLTWERITDGQ